jgi:hypothetical protein
VNEKRPSLAAEAFSVLHLAEWFRRRRLDARTLPTE